MEATEHTSSDPDLDLDRHPGGRPRKWDFTGMVYYPSKGLDTVRSKPFIVKRRDPDDHRYWIAEHHPKRGHVESIRVHGGQLARRAHSLKRQYSELGLPVDASQDPARFMLERDKDGEDYG